MRKQIKHRFRKNSRRVDVIMRPADVIMRLADVIMRPPVVIINERPVAILDACTLLYTLQ